MAKNSNLSTSDKSAEKCYVDYIVVLSIYIEPSSINRLIVILLPASGSIGERP